MADEDEKLMPLATDFARMVTDLYSGEFERRVKAERPRFLKNAAGMLIELKWDDEAKKGP